MGKKGSEWTEDEIKLLEECYSKKMPLNEIIKLLPKRTYGSISSKASGLGLTEKYIKNNNANYKADYNDYDWCYERFINRCMSAQEIAEESGYSKRVIEKWLYEKHHLDYKKDFRLSDLQKMLITSGCLGDGHIAKEHSVYIESHAENQKDYIFWKFDILNNMCNLKEPTYYSGKTKLFDGKSYDCQPTYRITTREIDCLIEIREMTRYDKINYLDGFGFSTHFLDDGYYNGTNWEICLAEWSKEEKDLYIRKLKECFNATARYRKDTRYIALDKESSDIMNKIILENIPSNLDIVKYKILKVA